MIVIKKVRAKNFLSIGNSWTEYKCDGENLCLLKGTNGSGKCVDGNTIIKLRNKITGEIIETTIGEFYESQEK